MLENLEKKLQIRTPEGIAFNLTLAGPLSRFLAWLFDLVCISAASKLLHALLPLFGLISKDIAFALSIILFFVISIGYGIFWEWIWRGQTLGKWLLRLRVLDGQGLRLRFSQIVLRNLMRAVDSLPFFYLVGGVACMFNKRYQRLGDIAANTIVTRRKTVSRPDLQQILADKYNSLRAYPLLNARLRRKISPELASLAMSALLRREELEPSARMHLFKELASALRALTTFPQEAVEGLSDERYVRNVVDIVFG